MDYNQSERLLSTIEKLAEEAYEIRDQLQTGNETLLDLLKAVNDTKEELGRLNDRLKMLYATVTN